MSDTAFTNLVTLTDADWFNDVNRLHYTIFGDPANIAAVITALEAGGLTMPDSYIRGLTLSNNVADATNDIDIAAGSARDVTHVHNITLASALTKRLDAAWAVGTNQGGLDTGSIANTTYHVYLIKRTDTAVVDVLFSISPTTPTMPANYTYKRRIGSILRASAAIRGFVQVGDRFEYKVPIADVAAVAPDDFAWTRALTVPEGIKVLWRGVIRMDQADYVLVSDLDTTDTACSALAFTLSTAAAGGGPAECITDTSGQVRTRNNDGALTFLRMNTHGWTDTRGRDA